MIRRTKQIPQDDRSLASLSRELTLDSKGFTLLSSLLNKEAGIFLPGISKNYALMANRLTPILLARGLHSYEEYFQLLQKRNQTLLSEFVSALTTHTTQFFRESSQIDLFKRVLTKILSQKNASYQTEIRIWCAACSTGQEAYSLAMIVRELISDLSKWSIKILATDIDRAVLEFGAKGSYTAPQLISLPQHYRDTYFTQQVIQDEMYYQVDRRLQQMVRFAPLNLLDPHYPFRHGFDVIFCRNVLIYFEWAKSEEIIRKLVRHLQAPGFLFVGASESGYVKDASLKSIAPSVYQKSPIVVSRRT